MKWTSRDRPRRGRDIRNPRLSAAKPGVGPPPRTIRPRRGRTEASCAYQCAMPFRFALWHGADEPSWDTPFPRLRFARLWLLMYVPFGDFAMCIRNYPGGEQSVSTKFRKQSLIFPKVPQIVAFFPKYSQIVANFSQKNAKLTYNCLIFLVKLVY